MKKHFYSFCFLAIFFYSSAFAQNQTNPLITNQLDKLNGLFELISKEETGEAFVDCFPEIEVAVEREQLVLVDTRPPRSFDSTPEMDRAFATFQRFDLKPQVMTVTARGDWDEGREIILDEHSITANETSEFVDRKSNDRKILRSDRSHAKITFSEEESASPRFTFEYSAQSTHSKFVGSKTCRYQRVKHFKKKRKKD